MMRLFKKKKKRRSIPVSGECLDCNNIYFADKQGRSIFTEKKNDNEDSDLRCNISIDGNHKPHAQFI